MLEPLVELIGVEKRYGDKVALPKTDLIINRKETVGLTGPSGCGKSTLCRMLLRLVKPTHGKLLFGGESLGEVDQFYTKCSMVFQDPYASLNPRMRVKQIVGEPLTIHRKTGDVKKLLELVGLGEDVLDRYPHEFSGGQRQRIGIARALAIEPEFLVLDEPVSALDVSIQAQVICLLEELRERLGFTILFVSHDPVMTEYFCDRVVALKSRQHSIRP